MHYQEAHRPKPAATPPRYWPETPHWATECLPDPGSGRVYAPYDPDIVRREGEGYRLGLELDVLELGLGDHVDFDNRFLAVDDLADLLAATDIFITPYTNREQIASGALTFGIAAAAA